jgi:hypothetical protein
MNRRTMAGVIILAWLSAIGWLVLRPSLGLEAGVVVREWPAPPGAIFMGVYRGEEQLGLATFNVDTLPEGLRVDELVTIDLPRQGQRVRRTTIRTEALYTKTLRLVLWETSLLTDQGRSTVQGLVGDNGAITLRNSLGARAETLVVVHQGPILLPSAVPFLLGREANRKIGQTVDATVFDPLIMQFYPVRLRVGAESTFVLADSAIHDSAAARWIPAHADSLHAWRLDGTERGLPLRRWVDDHGIPVAVKHGFGLSLVRSAFELVNTNFRSDSAGPAWDTAATVLTTEVAPATPGLAPVERMRVLLAMPTWPDVVAVPALDDTPQSRNGDTLTVTRSSPSALDGAPDSVRLARWLEPTPLISSESGVLQQRAADVIRNAPTALEKVRRLGTWVSRAVNVENRSGTQSASRTLARRTGTEQDRLVLLAALLRSQGIPARLVAGLREINGRFFVDGWVEAYAGSWVSVDPETGEVPADASRIRIAYDVPASPLTLTLLAGTAEVRLLEREAQHP